MNQNAILRLTIGSVGAAMMLIGASAAMAQARVYAPGTDCTKLPQTQQIDCQVQQQNSATTPAAAPRRCCRAAMAPAPIRMAR